VSLVEFKNVVKRYGEILSIDRLSLKVERGETLAVVGPNGAGKTTLLRLMAGLEDPTDGEIYFEGVKLDRNNIQEIRRRSTMVFQRTLLFETNVYNNVAYGLKLRRYSKSEIRDRVEEALSVVKMESYENRLPKDLSGGEQQRISLARALALDVDILILDEPTANLDPENTTIIEETILHASRGKMVTIVIATHNILQAERLTDKLAFLYNGRLAEIGRTQELLLTPSEFLASFMRRENVFSGFSRALEDGTAEIDIGGEVQIVMSERRTGSVTIFVRPEDILLSKAPLSSSARNVFIGKIVEILDLGSLVKLRVDVGKEFSAQITKHSFREMGLNIGSEVHITFKASSIHIA